MDSILELIENPLVVSTCAILTLMVSAHFLLGKEDQKPIRYFAFLLISLLVGSAVWIVVVPKI